MTLTIIAIILLIFEIAYFRIANKFNIIDKPNLRSSHTTITLRGGGIVFPFAVLCYALFFGFDYIWFIIGITLVATISFIDDIRSVKNIVRLAIHFCGVTLMLYQTGLINSDICWFNIIVALVFAVGIVNAFNFMDGINGITGGYSLSALIPLLIIDVDLHFIDTSFIIVSIISFLIFCFFNFRTKAKCFAGDVGSVSAAFIVLFCIGNLIFMTKDITYIVFLAVYGVDSLLTIIHRLILHENIGQPHRKHLYQLLANELHIPHIVVSFIYSCLQLCISLVMVLTHINHWVYTIFVFFVLTIAYILFMKKYYYLHQEYLNSTQKIKK